jgi:shikimate kinase
MLVFLIGFMGSGKTTIGKKLAKKLSLEFIDLDAEVEKKEGRTIGQIFDLFGEDYFRTKEHEILLEQSSNNNILIACGGGTPCFFDHMQMMNNKGITVYLKFSPEALYSRLENAKTKRPLLKNMDEINMKLYIKNKLEEREQIYLQAKIITEGLQMKLDILQKNILGLA